MRTRSLLAVTDTTDLSFRLDESGRAYLGGDAARAAP
jgi:hypothetical protein